ncbi:hypothetical protein [Ideonella dechloratans]|uniref:hypothetical protein n=1 Tax=Ideonella dechloratans TaxID=36863 RepID=UPI0035B4185E
MNPPDAPPAPVPGPPAAAGPVHPPGEDRLAHLFRHSLREGRLHPLYPLLRKYRQEAGQP